MMQQSFAKLFQMVSERDEEARQDRKEDNRTIGKKQSPRRRQTYSSIWRYSKNTCTGKRYPRLGGVDTSCLF